MSVDKVMLEAQRGLERLDRLKARLAEAGLESKDLAARAQMLGYLAGELDDAAWQDAEDAAFRYLAEKST
jgi:hypothetical protein